MNKIIALAAAALLSTSAFAQETGDKVLRIYTNDGVMTPVLIKDVQDITFEEVTPLSMDIDVESTGETEMVIDFPMPQGCSKWQMLVTPNELTGTEKEIRQAVKRQYMDEFTESKYFQIPNLSPATTYYIYALLYDADGVVAGLSTAQATTKSEVKDEFAINVSDITSTTANVTFTPKDKTAKYYAFIVPATDRTTMISQYGSIPKADLEFWKYSAEQYGMDLDFYLSQILYTGDKTVDAKTFTGSALKPSTLYYAYCYGVNTDGSATTDVYEQTFTTADVQKSDNVLTVSVTATYSDGCDVNVTTTNDDKYILDVQSKSTWNKFVERHNGDTKAAAEDIINTSWGDNVDSALKSGNFTGKLDYGTAGTDCVVIACGYDGGVTTDVQTVEFSTTAE